MGATLVLEEMDICNPQVSLQSLSSQIILLFLWKYTHSLFSFLFQFLLIVQPLEHVALIYHCHASQCVLINFWKAHTHTHLITDKAGGHIPDSEYKSNKHTHRKRRHLLIFTRQHFEPRTLVWRQWKLDIRTFL